MQLYTKEFLRLSTLVDITTPYDFISVNGKQYAAYREPAECCETAVNVKCEFLVHMHPGSVRIEIGSVFEVAGYKMTCTNVYAQKFDKNKRADQPRLPHQDDYPYDDLVVITVRLKATCIKHSEEKLAVILKEHKTMISQMRACYFINTETTKFKMNWKPCGHKRVQGTVYVPKDLRSLASGELTMHGYMYNADMQTESPLRLFVGDAVMIDGISCVIGTVAPCQPNDVLTGRIQFTCVAKTRHSTKERLYAWWKARLAEWKNP